MITCLFENQQIKVLENSSGEIFVKNRHSNVSIRISDLPGGKLRVSSSNLMTPGSINGLGCFLVLPDQKG